MDETFPKVWSVNYGVAPAHQNHLMGMRGRDIKGSISAWGSPDTPDWASFGSSDVTVDQRHFQREAMIEIARQEQDQKALAQQVKADRLAQTQIELETLDGYGSF